MRPTSPSQKSCSVHRVLRMNHLSQHVEPKYALLEGIRTGDSLHDTGTQRKVEQTLQTIRCVFCALLITNSAEDSAPKKTDFCFLSKAKQGSFSFTNKIPLLLNSFKKGSRKSTGKYTYYWGKYLCMRQLCHPTPRPNLHPNCPAQRSETVTLNLAVQGIKWKDLMSTKTSERAKSESRSGKNMKSWFSTA